MIFNFFRTIKYYGAIFISIFPIVSYADNVDEAAKCAATFRVLTSIELVDENLGQYFTKQNLFVYDLIGLYAEHYRNKNFTNGETSRLITKYQLNFDAKSSNGSYFIPYVQSCMGWTYKVSKDLQNSKNSKKKKIKPTRARALRTARRRRTRPRVRTTRNTATRSGADGGRRAERIRRDCLPREPVETRGRCQTHASG